MKVSEITRLTLSNPIIQESLGLYIKPQGMLSALIRTKYSYGRRLFVKRADKTKQPKDR